MVLRSRALCARKELRYKIRVRDGFSEIPLNTETLVFPLGANTKF